MKIESTNSLRTDFWPSYDEIDELNQRVNNVENEVDLLNINVISNDTEIRERISNLQNSYNEQIKTEKLIANQIDVNYASTDFLNSGNINSNNVYIEYLTVNRPVHDAVFNTVHLENATSLNGNFYSPNLIDAHFSGDVAINANVINANYANIDYLKVNLNREPINSSAVVGYDSDGHLIPIHAKFDVGFPSDANYIFTDSFGTAFPGVAADTVAPVNNLIQAGAVQNMYNDINNGFNTVNNSFSEVANTFNDINNGFNAVSDSFNNVANTFNDVNNVISDGFNTVNDTFNDVNNVIDVLNNNITETNNTLKDLIENYLTVDTSGFINSRSPINIQTVTEVETVRFGSVPADATNIGNGASMKLDGTKLSIYIPGVFRSQENCSYMFFECPDLNSNVEIPKNVVDLNCMFFSCYALNQNIAIPNSAVNCSGMFYECESLNQNIAIPNGVEDCSTMFGDCHVLNQNIAIPPSVTNCYNMFMDCKSLNQNIYIYSENITNLEYMFLRCTNMEGKQVHIRSSISLDTSNEFYNCLVNGSTDIDWTGRVINDLEEPTEWPPL